MNMNKTKKNTPKKAILKKKVPPIPKGFHTATPHLIVQDSRQAVEFYKKALGAKQRGQIMSGPDGKTAHAEITIGDSVVMMADEMNMPTAGKSPQSLGGFTAEIMLYVKNVDALYSQAVAAGATSLQAPTDMFWGDRYCRVKDPFGHVWSLATHFADPTPKQMEKAMAAMMAQMHGADK